MNTKLSTKDKTLYLKLETLYKDFEKINEYSHRRYKQLPPFEIDGKKFTAIELYGYSYNSYKLPPYTTLNGQLAVKLAGVYDMDTDSKTVLHTILLTPNGFILTPSTTRIGE